MKDNITAEEFLEQHNLPETLSGGTLKWAMIEFAKLHIEAALKAVVNNAEIENCGDPYDPEDDSKCINEKSILNSYPLENIK